MPQQEMCWFCGRAEKDCDYLMQSPLRSVVFSLTAKSAEGFATGTISLEGKAHAYICEECAGTTRTMIDEQKRDAAAANNHAPEHKE